VSSSAFFPLSAVPRFFPPSFPRRALKSCEVFFVGRAGEFSPPSKGTGVLQPGCLSSSSIRAIFALKTPVEAGPIRYFSVFLSIFFVLASSQRSA